MAKIGAKAAHFLAQKPWTPWRRDNQERIWAAEQEQEDVKKREHDRAEAIKRQVGLGQVTPSAISVECAQRAFRALFKT